MRSKIIGGKIREERIKQGLTQTELGALCMPKMKDSAIRRYELGRVLPKVGTLKKIADALNVSIAALDPDLKLEIENGNKNKDEQEERLLSYFILLNEDGKKKAIEQLEALIQNPEYLNQLTEEKK